MSRRYDDYVSKFHLDSLGFARRDEPAGLSCVWPDCDCEIKCDHINCKPPDPKPRYRIVLEHANPVHGGRVLWFLPMRHATHVCFVHEETGVWSREFPGGTYRRGWPLLTLDNGVTNPSGNLIGPGH